MLKLNIAVLCLIICLIGGCSLNPPHDNPLDPDSPGYTGTGSLQGRVMLLNFPSIGISSVLLYTIPATFTIVADSSGYFEFPEIPSGEYYIIASKTLFTPDTIHVTIKTAGQSSVNFFMNSYPVVSSTKILMRKIDQWWPNPVYSAEISASVGDQNGISDIDSVWFKVDSLLYPMIYSVIDKNFQLSLNSYQVPSNNIEWLVGQPLTVVARDGKLSSGASAPFFVSRMIEDEAVPDYPKFQDTTSGSPVFKWTAPSVRFLYTYSINVVRVDAGSQVMVWTQENIGSYLISYQYPGTLEDGNYFWTIAVVDEYGNYSRSKESTFVVK